MSCFNFQLSKQNFIQALGIARKIKLKQEQTCRTGERGREGTEKESWCVAERTETETEMTQQIRAKRCDLT